MSKLRIVRGNTFFTRSEVIAKNYAGEIIQNFDLEQATGVRVIAKTGYKAIGMDDFDIDGNYISILWKDIPCGNYGLDVSGIYDGIEWRFYDIDVLKVVESNESANIPPDCIIRDDYYMLDAVTLLTTEVSGGGSSVQSDWNESDSSAPSYIKNKPVIPTVPTNVSAFTNDAGYLTQHQDISGKANIADLATVATSGSYNDLSNKPTIPTVPTNVSAFTNDAGYLTQHQDISGKADKVAVVDHGTSDTTFALTPNTFHKWGTVGSLTLTLASGTAGYLSEYMFEFQSGSTATSLSLPSTVTWVDTPTIEANKTYQVSIVDNIAIIVGV